MSLLPPVPYPKTQQERYRINGSDEAYDLVNPLCIDFIDVILEIDTKRPYEISQREHRINQWRQKCQKQN